MTCGSKLIRKLTPTSSKMSKLARVLRYSKYVYVKPSNAIVSFTFDDVPGSAFTNGRVILDEYGKKGTFYIAMSLIREMQNVENELAKVIDGGHELGCHTFGHLCLTKYNKHEIELDLDSNQKEFNGLVPAYSFKNFAYPFGRVNTTAKSVTLKRFESARSVEAGINSGFTDLNRLKAIKLYEGLHPPEYAFEQIDVVINIGGWLIFYTHDVRADFSRYGCSPNYFRKVIQYCCQSGVEVLSVENALQNLKGR